MQLMLYCVKRGDNGSPGGTKNWNIRKKNIIDKQDVLQRIYWNDDAEDETELFDYKELRDHTIKRFNIFKGQGCSIQGCVNDAFYYDYEAAFEYNGMEKLACMVFGLLVEIEHGEVDPDLAYSTAWDIRDFETGNYDDLFSINLV